MFLHNALEQSAKSYPEHTAIVQSDGSAHSYQQFQGLVSALAVQLASQGVVREMRVGIYLPKHLLSAAAPFAVSMVGAIFVPINPLLTPAQVEHIAHDCGLSLLITSPDRASRISSALETLNIPLLLTDAPNENNLPSVRFETWQAHSSKKKCSQTFSAAEYPQEPNQALAALLYTSGSTGRPKGVMVSHQNLIIGAQSVNQYLDITASDRILALLPFSFDYGLNQLISSIMAGATCVLFDYLFPKDVAKAVTAHEITGIAGVPALWAQLAEFEWPRDAACSVRYVTNSGGHLPEPVLGKLKGVFPNATPYLMYGLTEAFRSTYLPPTEVTRRPNSIGIAIPNAVVLVAREDGSLASAGEEGELVHCGPLVAMGYWNRPEETGQVFRAPPKLTNEYPKTDIPPGLAVWSGDTVKQDEEGYFYFIGRRDAMIKTSGYRVSPEEVEEIFYLSHAVNSVGVIGVPDETVGQAIVVYVVLNDAAQKSTPDEIHQNLKRLCRENLPSYLFPKQIMFCELLPKNPNGKIDRNALTRLHGSKQSA